MSAHRILLVEDEPALADTLRQILTNSGYECRLAYDGMSALTLASELHPALVISDVVNQGSMA